MALMVWAPPMFKPIYVTIGKPGTDVKLIQPQECSLLETMLARER